MHFKDHVQVQCIASRFACIQEGQQAFTFTSRKGCLAENWYLYCCAVRDVILCGVLHSSVSQRKVLHQVSLEAIWCAIARAGVGDRYSSTRRKRAKRKRPCHAIATPLQVSLLARPIPCCSNAYCVDHKQQLSNLSHKLKMRSTKTW